MPQVIEQSLFLLLVFVADVCFLRLDFEEFSIRGTGGTAQTNEGVCLDTFTVTVSFYIELFSTLRIPSFSNLKCAA